MNTHHLAFMRTWAGLPQVVDGSGRPPGRILYCPCLARGAFSPEWHGRGQVLRLLRVEVIFVSDGIGQPDGLKDREEEMRRMDKAARNWRALELAQRGVFEVRPTHTPLSLDSNGLWEPR
jgi:hypothetical protein